MIEESTTATGGSHEFAGEVPSPARKDRAGVVRTARAIVRLARAHRRLEHVPTLGQVQAMAWFDGRRAVLLSARPRGELRARADGVRLRARARPARAVVHLPRPVRAGDGAGDDARRRRVRPAERPVSREPRPWGPESPALRRAGLRASLVLRMSLKGGARVRTVIAPLHPEVQRELGALDRRRARDDRGRRPRAAGRWAVTHRQDAGPRNAAAW